MTQINEYEYLKILAIVAIIMLAIFSIVSLLFTFVATSESSDGGSGTCYKFATILALLIAGIFLYYTNPKFLIIIFLLFVVEIFLLALISITCERHFCIDVKVGGFKYNHYFV